MDERPYPTLVEPISTKKLQQEVVAESRDREFAAHMLMCRNNFMPFCKLMMPDPSNYDDLTATTYQDAMHHRVMAQTLERVERGEITHLIVDMPPRHGKTQQISKFFPAWYVGRNPSESIIIATYNQTYAEDIGRSVKDILLDPRYLACFKIEPKQDSRSSDRIVMRTGGQLSFAGAGGSITGRGGHLLLADDLIKDAVQAESQLYRDRLWQWFTSVFMTRAMRQDAKAVLVMTRWHEDDIVGRLTNVKNPSYDPEIAQLWTRLHLRALAGPDDPLGRIEGEALWPQRFDAKWLERQRRLNPQAFQALYQGEPAPIDGQYFKKSWIQWYSRKELPPLKEMRFYGASDHAVGTDPGKKHDKTVMIVVGVDEQGRIYIVDCFHGRLHAKKIVEIMLNLIERWSPTFWWAEDGHITKAIGPWLMKRRMERGVSGVIDLVHPTKNKIQRSQSLQALMADGRVYFPKGQAWTSECVDELLKFPNGTHDDFVDALSWIGYKVLQIISKRGVTKPDATKPGTWGWWKKQIEFERQTYGPASSIGDGW